MSLSRRSNKIEIFVINLDSCTKRLERFKAHMNSLNVPFNRWSATYGDSLNHSKFNVEPIEDGVYICGFNEQSRNEAACGVSHIRLLQHIVRNGFAWTIVMEDDAFLNSSVSPFIEDWELPEDAEIVFLGERALYNSLKKFGKQFSYGELSGGFGTEGYLVSLSGAQKLLRILYPLKDPLDFQMYSHCESIQKSDQPPYNWKLPQNSLASDVTLKAYRIEPSLVVHAEGDSTIGKQRHPNAVFFCKVILNYDVVL